MRKKLYLWFDGGDNEPMLSTTLKEVKRLKKDKSIEYPGSTKSVYGIRYMLRGYNPEKIYKISIEEV